MSDEKEIFSPFRQYRRPDDGLPWFVNVIITTRCNMRCQMCRSYEIEQDIGPTGDVISFFKRLGAWLPLPRMAILTGGEPLLHADIMEYVRALSAIGFIPALNTNGAALTDEKVAELKEAGLEAINFSLDSVGKMHDEQRRGPGLAGGVLDMISHVSRHTDWAIGVVSVISALSAEGLPELVKRVSENDRLGGIQFQAVIPTMAAEWDDGFFDTNPLWPQSDVELNQVLNALDRLENMRGEGYPINNPPSQFAHWRKYFRDPKNFTTGLPCRVPDDNLLISAQGKVQFCNHYGDIGSLKDDPEKLWNSEKAKKMRREMEDCDMACNFFVNCCFVENR